LIEDPTPALIARYMTSIAPFLADLKVEDVCINQPFQAFVFRGRCFEEHKIDLDLLACESIAVLAGALTQTEVGTRSPLLDTELPTGERLHVSMFPTVPRGEISLTIRRRGKQIAPGATIHNRYRTEFWNEYLDARAGRDMRDLLQLYRAGDVYHFLRACVREKMNVLFVGPTGVSKTTLLETMLAEIDLGERIITIEDAFELNLLHRNRVRHRFVRNDQREDLIKPETLFQGCMRERPDRIILAEIRGPEALDFVSDACPTHPGTLSGIHGSSVRSGLRRLFDKCKAANAGGSYDDATLRSMIADVTDVVVPLYKTKDQEFAIGRVWFVADAQERGESALDLLRETA
jgi:type IV secretion system protein VirB11